MRYVIVILKYALFFIGVLIADIITWLVGIIVAAFLFIQFLVVLLISKILDKRDQTLSCL
jgi:hypothetical protein